MPTHTYNPVRLLLRGLGVAGLAGMVYLTWQAGWEAWDFRGLFGQGSNLKAWAQGAAALLVWLSLLGLGYWVTITAVLAPVRSHLVLALVIGGLCLGGLLSSQAIRLLEAVLEPSASAAVQPVAIPALFWGTVLAFCLPADRWLSKRAGFVPGATPWWTGRNIRGACVLIAWIVFFSMTVLAPETDDLRGVVREDYLKSAGYFGFLGLVIGCVLFAKVVPRLLIRLTDAPRDAPAPKRTGFHLY